MRADGSSWYSMALAASLLVSCSVAPEDPGEVSTTAVEDTSVQDTEVPVPDGADLQPSEVEDGLPPLRLPETLSGGFVDLSEGLESWPPFEVNPGEASSERLPDVSFGIFADLNGGTSLEVILSGDVGADLPRQTYGYDKESGGLVPWDEDSLPPGVVSAVLDLDGDGMVDALMAEDGGTMGVRWGDALSRFEELSPLETETQARFSERGSFHLIDLDQDGWLDIMMNDTCGMALLFRTGPRTWTHRAGALQGFDAQNPYALSSWPVAGRTPVIFALGHPSCGFYSGFEQSDEDGEGYPLYEPVSVYDPGQHHERPEGVTGMISPMGAAVADLDRDDLLDLFVTLDPAHIIVNGATPWPVSSTTPDSGLLFIPADAPGNQVGWGVSLVDLDADGLDDVVVAHGDDAGRFLGEVPSPGDQWATVHLNMGGMRFLDATEHLGLGRRGQWRALSVGDLDGDADPDFIVGGVGEAPRVYRNDLETPNRRIALRLEGRTSNRLGIGAHVIVNPLGRPELQRYAVGASGSPKAISQPIIYAGIGTAAGANVTVHWPSGVVQRVEGLIAGATHQIVEPELLTVSPATRRVSAGGQEVITLRVRPESPATSVSAIITHGDGIPGAAVDQGDGSWSLTIQPPPGEGSARVEVRVDGEPIPIRPRLFWGAP